MRFPPECILQAAYFGAGVFNQDTKDDEEQEEIAEAWARRDSLKNYA